MLIVTRPFLARFGLDALLDHASKVYTDSGLAYLRLGEADLLARVEREPRLLRLPLVRCGKLVAAGDAPDEWKAMAELK